MDRGHDGERENDAVEKDAGEAERAVQAVDQDLEEPAIGGRRLSHAVARKWVRRWDGSVLDDPLPCPEMPPDVRVDNRAHESDRRDRVETD